MHEVMWTMPWFGWIALVAIVTGSISGMFKMWITHRERLAMIRQGMHPDGEPGMRKSTINEL